MRACIALLSICVACGNGAREAAVQIPEPRTPQFEDYPAGEIYQGPLADVDLSSAEGARRFRTVIRSGAKSGPNFAGHYTVVGWGCGTMCQTYAIVDAKSGKVFMPHLITELGAEYRLDSKLFVANEPELAKDWCFEGAAVKPDIRYYVWGNERLTLIDTLVACP